MYLFLFASGLSCLSVFHSKIVQFILNILFPVKTSTSPIREEIKTIETELSKVSMVDEFPKYARLQRKLNVLKDQLSTDVQSKVAVNMKHRLRVKLFLQSIFVWTSIFSFYMFRSVPVIKLPAEWLEPHPFSHLISWPSREPGGVSFIIWFTVSGQVFRLIKAEWK